MASFKFKTGAKVALGTVVGGVVLALAAAAAWVTHLVWIIRVLASDQGATAGQIVLGLLGLFVPPVGVIHGLIIWLT